MRSYKVTAPNQPLAIQSSPIPNPAANEVRLKVEACGICHSDSFCMTGGFPGTKYPVVPGHEVAGVIDAVGSDVREWKVGQRAGVGWYGGRCGVCVNCLRGDFLMCVESMIPGLTRDGGYAEYVLIRREALAAIPDELSAVDAAPLLCAGVTTYNSLRHSVARPGDVVAILGVGGLGHLGVQYANKMGFNTVAIARGADKKELAINLGAHHYIDSQAQNVAEELNKLGGAKVVLSTVTNAQAMSAVIDGLAIDGQLMIVGASVESLTVSPIQLLSARRQVKGWASGTAADSEDTMKFSALTGIRPMVETVSLADAAKGYERMMSGKARFRVVLVP
jgi:alcohol dehydrogenase/propanol-preferring alcohol dehydrogenase